MSDTGDFQKHWRRGGFSQNPLGNLQRGVNHLFEEFMAELPLDKVAAFAERFSSFSPRLDLWEGPTEYIATVDLPGLTHKDVEITLTKDELVIRGQKKRLPAGVFEEPGSQIVAERLFGDFKRRVALDAEVEQDRVQAAFKDGVLTIRMSKKNSERVGVTKVVITTPEE